MPAREGAAADFRGAVDGVSVYLAARKSISTVFPEGLYRRRKPI